MKSFYKVLLVSIGIGVVVVLATFTAPVQQLGGRSVSGTNSIGKIVHSSTSTVASRGNPVLLSPTTTQRSYLLVTNDSGTVVYLFFKGVSTTADASAQITTLADGIRLNANGGSYEMDSTNLFPGALWASSTAGALTISVTEGL